MRAATISKLKTGAYRLPVLILAATLAAYAPALLSGFVWDDDDHVTENPNLSDLSGLGRIWTSPTSSPQYYPLTHTTFWIEHRIWGLRPLGYHLVNVLLHAASAILLGVVLTRLAVPGAWLAAALFALHPVHVESVAWITERKNVLSALFYLAAAAVLFRPSTGTPARHGRAVMAGVALYACTLLSKTVTATLPIALVLVFAWKKRRPSRVELLALAAMLVAGIALGMFTVHLERSHVGAEGPEFALSPVERVLVAGRAIWFYLGKLAWPVPLSFVYERFSIDVHAAKQYLFPAAAIAAGAALWLGRKRMGTGPLLAASYFVVTLSPALGFFNVFPMRYAFVADHFQYLASIGPIALFAAGWAALPWRGGAVRRRLATGALLAVLGLLTFRQAQTYRDPETLWRSTIRTSPRAFMAHYNLGNLLKRSGRPGEAIEAYREAIALRPDLVEAWINLGNTLTGLGRHEEAIASFERALQEAPSDPLTLFNLGVALWQVGRIAEAESAYRSAIHAKPDFVPPRERLARLLLARGDPAAAWVEVHAMRDLGAEPDPLLLRSLSERMPDPRW